MTYDPKTSLELHELKDFSEISMLNWLTLSQSATFILTHRNDLKSVGTRNEIINFFLDFFLESYQFLIIDFSNF